MTPSPDFAPTHRESDRARALGSKRPSVVRLGSIPADSAQDLRFAQDRVALFAKTTFFIATMFLIATMAADQLAAVPRYSTTARASHALGTAIALSMWLVARRRKNLSPRSLQAVDSVGTIGIAWSFAVMGHHTLQPYGSYTGILAVTYVAVTRSMIVPSVPQRSLLIAMVGFGALLVSRMLMPIPESMAQLGGSRARSLLEAFLWSTAGSAVVTVASTVIYGLQEKAREARQLGQYTLEEKIGEGGMGEVYRAHHAMLRRATAVKLLSGDGSEEQLRRFEKEVRLTARLTHPNTISVYDYGRTPDGIFYYAMELLEGMTLEELVRDHGPLEAGRVIHVLVQVCGALGEAHGIGLIHRDIKPANIHLCRRGGVPDYVKVLDFGLVREIHSDADIAGSNVDVLVGTPLYISPEAILTPDRMDGRADIYGLGCVAYFLLTGRPPFEGKNVVELCAHHLHTVPQPPSKHRPVPQDLEQLVLACLEKERVARPESAEALAAALERCNDAHSWRAADAAVWWQRLEKTATTAPLPPAAPSLRTICCADLEQRIAQRPDQ